MKKTGRNDPCVCGSGKKFKKCCERKMIGKKFMATKIDTISQNSSLSSFFQRNITPITSSENTKIKEDLPPVEPTKKISAQLKTNEKSDAKNILIDSSNTQKS